ncbi:unnamed protein product [Closterium sp. NIES-65]|nr:unnamed protein product [Closterium sp. NIES-65]
MTGKGEWAGGKRHEIGWGRRGGAADGAVDCGGDVDDGAAGDGAEGRGAMNGTRGYGNERAEGGDFLPLPPCHRSPPLSLTSLPPLSTPLPPIPATALHPSPSQPCHRSPPLPFAPPRLQILKNAALLRTNQGAALGILSWLGFATGFLGNMLLLSYFTAKRELSACLVQVVGAASTAVLLSQVYLAGFMPSPAFTAVAAYLLLGCAVNCLRFTRRLPQPLWDTWQDVIGVLGLAVLPQHEASRNRLGGGRVTVHSGHAEGAGGAAVAGQVAAAEWLDRHAALHGHARRPAAVQSLLTQSLLTQSLLTQSLLTQSLLTQSLLTQSLLTQSLLSQSLLTQSLLTQSLLTQSLLTQSLLTQSLLTQSLLTQSLLTQSLLTQSLLTQSLLTQSLLTQSLLSQSLLSQSLLTQSLLTQSLLTQSLLSQSLLTQSLLSQSLLTQSLLTQSLLTQSLLTQSLLTQSLLTQSLLTQSLLTQSLLTQSLLTQSLLTQSLLTQSLLSQSLLTQSLLTQSLLTQSLLTQSLLSQSLLSQSLLTQSLLTQSLLTQSLLSQSLLTQSLLSQSLLTQSLLTQSLLTQSLLTQSLLTQSLLSQSLLSQSLLSQSLLTQSLLTQSLLSQSLLSQSLLTQSLLTQSLLTQSLLSQSLLTQSLLTQSLLTQSLLTQSLLTQSLLTQSLLSQSLLTQSLLTQSLLTQSLLTQSLLTQSLLTQSLLSQSLLSRSPHHLSTSSSICPPAVCFTRPDQLAGMSALSSLLGIVGNGLMVPRALFTRDFIWFLGCSWGCILMGWGVLLAMALHGFYPPRLFMAVSLALIGYLAAVFKFDADAHSLLSHSLYNNPLRNLTFIGGNPVNQALRELDNDSLGVPEVVVKEYPDAIKIVATVPGLEKKDLQVQVRGKDVVTISGKRTREERDNDDSNRVVKEFSSFERSFRLPCDVSTKQVTAAAWNGVLTVTVPKRTSCKQTSGRRLANPNAKGKAKDVQKQGGLSGEQRVSKKRKVVHFAPGS